MQWQLTRRDTVPDLGHLRPDPGDRNQVKHFLVRGQPLQFRGQQQR